MTNAVPRGADIMNPFPIDPPGEQYENLTKKN